MNFEKYAYLFDSSLLREKNTSSVYSLMSLVGNPTVIYSLLNDTLKKVDLQVINDESLKIWISDTERFKVILNIISNIINNKDKIEAYSFFIDRDFSNFLVSLGLIITKIDPHAPMLTEAVNRMYQDFVNYKQSDEARGKSYDLQFVNDFIGKWSKRNRQYQAVSEILKHARPVQEQVLLKLLADKEEEFGVMIASDFYYTRFFSDFYAKRDVKNIYATSKTGGRFLEATKDADNKYKFNVHLAFGNAEKEVDRQVENLARVLVMVSEYAINQIVNVDDVALMSDNDKLLFIMVWVLFQGNDNNWLMNLDVYNKIGNLFNSVKKDLDV